MFCWNTTSFLAFRTPDVTREIKMFTSTLTCNAIAALHCPKWPHLSRSFHFLVPPFTMLLLSRVLTVCSALGSTCLLACPLSGSGWPYRGQSPIFPDVAVGWGNFVTAAPAAPPCRPPKCQNAAAASPQGGRTEQNTATKTKATKGERTDDTRLGWDRPRPRSDDGS